MPVIEPREIGRRVPRRIQPELEREYSRNPALGYEPTDKTASIRCLSHGFPTPLARWHYHDEYELHLITASTGKAFIGDYIGHFQPGHLVLTGPRLPHNWISLDLPPEGITERDLVIQFAGAPFENAAASIHEFSEVLPLLERAKHGIEFFGMAELAQFHWKKIKAEKGLTRFAAFCEYLSLLGRCKDYRLLSNSQLQSVNDNAQLEQINTILCRIADNLAQPVSAAVLAQELGMTESRFSRFFSRATGNTLTDCVNQMRISQACRLLTQSDRLITQICFEVGFQNIANFNRRFLEFKGMTPREFRRQADSRFGLSH
jgi:AraC-like DNA-binding protein